MEKALRVSELEGMRLDYWVGQADGIPGLHLASYGVVVVIESEHAKLGDLYRPSVDWNTCGPIIEREIYRLERHDEVQWEASSTGPNSRGRGFLGPTPLIAAMRAYVASKFGDEVPDDVS